MMRSARLFAAAAPVALALGLAACSGGAEKDAPAPEARAAAAVPAGERLRVERVAIPDVAEVPATITTRDMAEARARIPGVLADLRVREGDRVAAGQRIGTIVDSRLGQEAAAYAASAAAAEAQAARARADLERIRFLHREGVYAQAKLDEATAMARAAEAQVRAARAQQGAVDAVAGQGAVIAPASGRVLRADIPAGSAVAPGTPIAVITAGPPVIRLDVAESLGRRLAPGQSVTVTGLAGRAEGVESSGQILTVYPGVAAGRVTADASFPGLDPQLVGQRVTARVLLGERVALAVPERFIQTRFGLSFAMLLAPDGRSAAQIPVEVRALPGTGRVEILSGLRAGDVIVAPVAAPAGSAA